MKLFAFLTILIASVFAAQPGFRANDQPRDMIAQIVDRISMIQSELELVARQFQRTLIGSARVSRLVSEKIPSVEDIEAITKQLIETNKKVVEMATLTNSLRQNSIDGRQLPGLPSGGLPGLEQIMAMFSQLAAQFQQLGGLLSGITTGLVRAGGSQQQGGLPGGLPNPLEQLQQILAQLTGNLGTMGEAFRLG